MTLPDPIPLPPYAYLPGQSPRHAPDAFAALHDSVAPGADAESLAQCAAWHAGWLYLQRGFFWEAHEVLEPVWMACAEGTRERQMVQAVIQMANAALKLRMNKRRSALRLCMHVDAHLRACAPEDVVLGRALADVSQVLAEIRSRAATTGPQGD